MKKSKIISVVFLILVFSFSFAACSDKNAQNEEAAEAKTTLLIGTEPNSQICAASAVSYLEDLGYEVQIVMFDDYVTPNISLDEKSIDANFYQHQPYLTTFNQEHGTDIVMLAPCFMFFRGIYSQNFTSIEDLMENGTGGTIALAKDATNQSIGLKCLETAGIITLVDEEKDLYNVADIAENPGNFEFVTLDSAVALASTEEYAAWVQASNTMYAKGLDPTADLLYYIDATDQALGICVNAEDADTQWAKDLVAAYTSDSAKQYVKDNFSGAMVPVE